MEKLFMSNNNFRILSEPISYQELKLIPYNISISGIYKIENLINHKVYIGQSKNVFKRLREHTKVGKEHGKIVFREFNEHLRSSFEKYGFDKFSFEVLKETYDMNYWEIFLIQIYHANDRRYGYNISVGGTYGDFGEEWRKRVKDSVINVLNSPKGDEIRKKISESKLGKPAKNKGTKWYNNGEISIMTNNPPEGFVPGVINKNCLPQEEWQSRYDKIKLNEEIAKLQEQERKEREKESYSNKSSHWYNNGIKSIRAKQCPEGFVPGRLGNFSCPEETKQKKREIEKNLTSEQRAERARKLSKSHKGKYFTEEQKKHIGDGNRGRKYFNNGEIEVMQFECPPGFVPGRCPKSKANISKGMRNS